MLGFLGEAYRAIGQPKEGFAVVQEAFELARRIEQGSQEVWLSWLTGELALPQGNVPGSGGKDDGSQLGRRGLQEEAEEYFRHALDLARRQEAKWLELKAVMSLSRLWSQQGKHKEAHQLLAAIYGWFTEGFDTAELKRARALLEELQV